MITFKVAAHAPSQFFSYAVYQGPHLLEYELNKETRHEFEFNGMTYGPLSFASFQEASFVWGPRFAILLCEINEEDILPLPPTLDVSGIDFGRLEIDYESMWPRHTIMSRAITPRLLVRGTHIREEEEVKFYGINSHINP